jgi:hypothetical protein
MQGLTRVKKETKINITLCAQPNSFICFLSFLFPRLVIQHCAFLADVTLPTVARCTGGTQ